MKSLKILLVTFLLLTPAIYTYGQTIDSAKSEVKFQIKGGGLFTVKGTMGGMKGDFKLDTNNIASSNFNICIDAATVNTKNKKRDTHLRDPDFFNVENYPTVCFESTSVSKTESGYTTKGNLTILDVTKEVEIPFEFNNNTFTGTLIVNRFDYNLGKDYGTVRVGSEAKITINCIVN